MFSREKSPIVVSLLFLIVCPFCFLSIAAAQDGTSDAKVIERYKLMLHRKPKEGSTFDRVYQFYLEGAGLDAMLTDYQTEAQANPNNFNVQLILGHLYKRLGKDVESVSAYQRAVQLAPDSYYPHFALGQMHAALRQHEEAIGELTKAAALSEQAQNVPLEELTAIYKALGHAYFRRDNVEDAIQAWQKISELNPQDIFARIELADLFREQELYEQAISQHETIIQQKQDDPYRVCLSRREIGNIHQAKGDYPAAVQSYDAALALTAPGNWLRKDLQHRIIGIYAADSNWEGLIGYYQGKLEATPNEPELLGLLAAASIENQQLEEGISTYRKGLELAPTDTNLRLNLIASLRNAEKFEDAAAEYEKLSEQAPDDFGIYRELGELYLQLGNRDKAKAAYQKMIERAPNSAGTHLILAEIYAGHEWLDDAIAQYEKASSLEPNNLDYIEYFGEFYFRQGNREKALETWNRIVAGDKNTAENHAQLAQLLNAKNFKTEAVAAIRKAVTLMPDEYRYRETLAKQLMEHKKYDEALTEYTAAMKLAPNPFFAEKMDDQRIELYRRQGTLLEKIELLEAELGKPGLSDTEKFTNYKQLTKMSLKLSNITYALEVLLKAKTLQPDDVAINRWLADIYTRQGRRNEANAIYTHLIAIDTANAREYHANIAKSYLNVMDFEAATTAAKQVIAHSPRNPEGHQLLAQIAKQSKNYETAIDSLKQAIRLRPEAIDTRAELADIYKLSGNLHQALSQYWRCWDLSGSVNDKLTFVKPLSEIYYDLGRRGEFEEKLKQLAKSNTTGVGPVLALAELYRMEGDLPSARFQLAQALNKQRENPELLSHLVQISIALGDVQDALTYQQRLVKANPDATNQQRLGELLFDAGREQEAIQAWTKLLHAKNRTLEAEIKLAALLLRHGLSEEAFFVLDRAAEKIAGTDAHIPLYRLGTMLVGMNEPERAHTYFQRILEMPEPTIDAKKQETTKPTIYTASNIPGVEINKFEIARGNISRIQSKPTFTGGGTAWIPKTFEETQTAALVHLTTIAQQQGKLPQLVQHFEANAEANPTDIKALETLVQLYTLVQYNDKAEKTIDRLIEISPNDAAYQPLRVHRAVRENLNYETFKKSLDEIPGLVPEARLRYTAEYAQLLSRSDKKEDAIKLMHEIEDVNVTDISTGFMLVEAFLMMDKTDSAEKILLNLPIPPQKQQQQYQRLFERLTDAYIDQGELDKTAALFWVFCERTKPNAVNSRRVAALPQSSYYYGGYRPIQTNYPTTTAYFNRNRLNYLQSIFREFWMREQQETLYTKFQTELDAAKGRDRIYPSLALSYCYWWAEKRDKAQEVLSTLQKEFPDDLTLKLNTAFVSIQNGKHGEALKMITDLAEIEPRNRQQYRNLLLQLAIRTGDSVSLRALITKLLNSAVGAQELYQLSQTLQNAGFTQYAISAAKKAMTLAMAQRNPNFLIDLAEHLGRLGRGQDAARLAERALRFASQTDRYGRTMYSWNMRQAVSLTSHSKNMQEREKRFIAEAQKNPEAFQAQLKLAMFYENTNQIEKASQGFKKALELQPKDSITRLRYVRMLERAGKAMEALPEYTTLLKNDSTALGYDYKKAIDAFVAAGEIDALILLTKELILPVGQYAGNDFTQKVAQRCLTENRPDAAIEIFEKILQVHPSWDYIHRELAAAYLADGNPEKAIQYLTEKYELGKTSLSETAFQLKIAEFHETAGGRENAIQFLREQTKTGGESTVVFKLAEYYEVSGELENFIAEYEAKLAENPSATKLLYILTTLKIKANDIEGANAHVTTLIDNALMSINTQWLYNLAEASDKANAHPLQFRLLEAAAEKLEHQNSWKLADCYEKLGEAYAKRGEQEKAQNALRKMGTLQTMEDSSQSVYEKRGLASTYMRHEMWDDAEKLLTEIINDLSASSYERERAQEQFMQIKQNRDKHTTPKELAKKTEDLDIGMQRAMAKEFMQQNQVEEAVEIFERITETMPEDLESRAQLATLYSRLEQHEKASQVWTTLLDADPENTKYQDGLVNSLQHADKLNEAFELAQKYIQTEPEVGVHYVRLAKLYAADDKVDEAIATYEKALEFSPGDRQIYLKLGDLYLLNDDMAAAENAFRNAIQFTASEWERQRTERKLIGLYRSQGKLAAMLQKAEDEGTLTYEMQKEYAKHYQNVGNLEKAADAYKKVLDLTTQNYERQDVISTLIDIYAKLNKNDSALQLYEAEVRANPGSATRSTSYGQSGITINFTNDEIRKALVKTYKEQGKLDSLQTIFEDRQEKEPGNVPVIEMLAEIYRNADNHQKAAEVYQKLSKVLSGPKKVHTAYDAAIALHKSGQPELAKAQLKKAEAALQVSSRKQDDSFLAALATLCLKNQMYDSAIELADAAVTEMQRSGDTWVKEYFYELLGKSYLGAERYEEAFAAYRQMANSADDSYTRDRAETEMDKIAKAHNLYEKWIPEQLKQVQENPDDVNARLKLAESYEYTEKIKETVEQYEKLTQLQPDNVKWYKKLADLYQKLMSERLETGETIEGTALTLDGNRSFVEIGDSESLNNITEQVTLSAWIKPTNFPQRYVPIIYKGDKRNTSITNRSFTLWLRDDRRIQFSTSPGGQAEKYIFSPSGTIQLNRWYHVAGLIDAKRDVIKLFIDGIEVERTNFNGKESIHKSEQLLRIGGSHEEEITTHASFAGQIDEVRVWNIARTEDQIRADMNRQLNGDEPGLVGYWKFDAETEDVITDHSPNENSGKRIGDAKLEPYNRTAFEVLSNEKLAHIDNAYEKAIELEPTSYQLYDGLAKFYVKTNDIANAEAVYRQALEVSLTQSEHDSAIHAIVGLYPGEEQEEKRIAILEGLKPKMEKSAALHELLGALYERIGDAEKAGIAYDRWLEIRERELNRGQSASSYRNFANTLMQKDRYPEMALKFAKRASQRYTGSSQYLYLATLGQAYIANELYDTALKHFKQALSTISSEYASDQFWKQVADANKNVKDKERYLQMLETLVNTTPSENASSRANVYRVLAQFYSENDTPENVENYLLAKTGFVPETRWLTLGPFKNIDSHGVLYAYIPEETTHIDTTAKYYGRDGLISWKKSKYELLDGHYVFSYDDDSSAAYVWAILISPDERDIVMRFDSDDQGTVWLNGKQVFRHDRTSGTRIDRYTIPVSLKQGENTILIKICNARMTWDFYMRLTDADGVPFSDLKFKTADELLNAPPPEPTFHVNAVLGMAEYYSKNNMPDKAMEQMLQTGIVHENAWLILGPFDNSGGVGHNTAYIPEDTAQIDVTAEYQGVAGQIRWNKSTDNVFDGFIDLGKDVNWSVSYASATVTSPDEREVQFRFGSDDQGKIWLNGKEVFANPEAGWAVLDRDVIPVTLKPGKNTILVKVCNGELSWGFFFRITDTDGNPFEDLKINDPQDN